MYWHRPPEGGQSIVASLPAKERERLGRLKFGLVTKGIRISPDADATLAKPEIRVRSGVSGGIDLVLPGEIHVNCTTTESFSENTPYLLSNDKDGGFSILENGQIAAPALLIPRPKYYDLKAHDGTPMVKVAQMCSADRVCVNLARECVFWKREDRCAFCSIGGNTRTEADKRRLALVAEVVECASKDSILAARHVLLGGGTPNHDDRGARVAAELAEAILSRTEIDIYAMIAPPSDLADLERLRDAGVRELGLNIELFDHDAMKRFTPGKFRHIGPEGYLKALERAVDLFGPWNTRAILVAGLEPLENTLAGVRKLAAMGVLPILSPFRPLRGAELEHHPAMDVDMAWTVFAKAEAICGKHGIAPGPSCIACQNNTLALPDGPNHRYY